jgi:hypothetical protein
MSAARRLAGRAQCWLAQPVDGASLAVFRICFGLVMLWEAARYLWPRAGGSWIQRFYCEPGWNFPYHGFEWVRPWPEPFMTLHWVVFGLAGLAVAVGLCYRTSAATLAVVATYSFLLEESKYLNHFYLMCLLSFLLALMPAQRCWSVDAWLARRRGGDASGTVPFWPVFLLRFQLFVVYLYGGIAKLDSDWLTGDALTSIENKTLSWIALVLDPVRMEALKTWIGEGNIAWALAAGGLIFDLAIGPMLIARRTRYLGLALCAMFHGYNSQAFSIGVFPLLAFTGTLIFCETDWPRRVGHWLCRPRLARPDWGWLAAGVVVAPIVGVLAGWSARKASAIVPAAPARLGRWVGVFVLAWATFHVTWPLRHYAIDGDANWTEEGHRFSWRMMLRSKGGYLQLAVFDPELFVTDATGKVDVDWQAWTRRFPKVVHQDVDAIRVDWSRMPELVVFFDPLVGERIVYNHRASDREAGDDPRAWLEGEWQERYGRSPAVHPTVPIVEALRDLRARVTEAAVPVTEEADLSGFLERLSVADDVARREPATVVEWELRTIDLTNALQTLVADEHFGVHAQEALARTHPFTLQGCEHIGFAFLAVEDPVLQVRNRHRRWLLDRSKWAHGEVVHLDLTRIRHEGWVSLPQVLVCYQEGQPRLEWNYHLELIPRQISQLQQLPFMVHQYAQRVAERWTGEFGRRPAVYAATALVSFNGRMPQPIIDPAADLAAAPMRVFFGHNDWILHLDQSEPPPQDAGRRPAPEEDESLERPRYAAIPLPTEEAATFYPNGRKRSERLTDRRGGSLHSTTTVWTEEGRVLMQAQYVDSLLHGAACRWHRNGRLATEVGYQHGKRHGPAKIRYETGAIAWEGTFVDGRQHGLATGYRADGRIAHQAEFADGRLVRDLTAPAAERIAADPASVERK